MGGMYLGERSYPGEGDTLVRELEILYLGPCIGRKIPRERGIQDREMLWEGRYPGREIP